MKSYKRLNFLSTLLSDNAIMADIGSDHGYLPLLHILKNNGKKAYACDINPNALKQAEHTLKKYPNLNIELQLMPGLQNLKSDVEEIVIAGMGFETIKMILENDEEKALQCNKIILQCNKDIEKLRQFLKNKNYYLLGEYLVEENQIFYEILVVSLQQGKNVHPLETDEQYQTYLNYLLRKIEQIPNFQNIEKLRLKYEQLQTKLKN